MNGPSKPSNPSMNVGISAVIMTIVMGIVVPNIKNSEGEKYVPYKDIGGVLTVCNGHTGPDVIVTKVYTDQKCSALTEKDVEKAAAGVLKTSPHLLYHPMQLAAVISFSYNVGVGTYDQSSVAKDFNSGNFVAACNDLLKYTYADHKYSVGLANRRNKEWTLCMSTMIKGN